MAARDELAPGTIALVQARVAAPPVAWSTLERAVSAEETARAARFLHDIDRRRHILGRGLLRLALAPLLDTEPQDIRFAVSELGKPALPGGPSFNIAHSGDYVLIALAADGRLGVDVEAVRPLRDLLRLARTSFGPDEYERIVALPPEQRSGPFFRTWTRKEAMLKALGCGLTGLRNISVSFEPHMTNALLRLDDPAERPDAWTVRPLAPGADAEAAVAWDRPIERVVEHGVA